MSSNNVVGPRPSGGISIDLELSLDTIVQLRRSGPVMGLDNRQGCPEESLVIDERIGQPTDERYFIMVQSLNISVGV